VSHADDVLWRQDEVSVEDEIRLTTIEQCGFASGALDWCFYQPVMVTPYRTSRQIIHYAHWVVGASVPLLLSLLIVPPMCIMARSRFRKWSRARRNLCVPCGYDLRGSPRVCPECGNVARPLGVTEQVDHFESCADGRSGGVKTR